MEINNGDIIVILIMLRETVRYIVGRIRSVEIRFKE